MPERPPLFRQEALDARSSTLSGAPLETPADRYTARSAGEVGRHLGGVPGAVRALLRRRSRERPLRVVRQMEAMDCGACSLATVLDQFGIDAPLADLRRQVDAGRDGASALRLLEVARRHGLVARGVRTEVEGLALLPRGSILHWGLNHFVVLDRARAHGIRIVDPASGPREVPARDVARKYTGIALVFEGERVARARRTRRARSGVWSNVLPLLRDRRLWRSVVVATVLAQALVLAFPLMLRQVLNDVIPDDTPDELLLLWVAVLPILLGQVLVAGIRAVMLSWLRARIDFRLTLGIFNRLFSLPYAYLARRSTGDLLMRVRSTTALRQFFTTNVLSSLVDGSMALVLAVVVVVLSPKLFAIMLAVVVIQVLVLAGVWRAQRDLSATGLEAQAVSQSRLVQLLSGIQTIKIAGAEAAVADGWAQLLAEEANVEARRSINAGVTEAAWQGVRIVGPIVLLLAGTREVLAGTMNIGTMVAVTTVATAVFTPVTMMLGHVFNLATVRGYLDRINDIFEEEPERATVTRERLSGAVGARDLTFSYAGGGPLLTGVTFDIHPGESVAIMGPSGAGKSTIAMLLAGLYEPTSGTVLLDGRPLAELSPGTLREQLGFMPQHPYFFGGTITENVALFRDVPEDLVDRVLTLADLHDDIAKLPLGAATLLAERGDSLSGGQLQRVGIARALLSGPRVLILDEATSALDEDSERRVLANLLGLGLTTILITHRSSVAALAQRVFVLTGGRLVEQPRKPEAEAPPEEPMLPFEQPGPPE